MDRVLARLRRVGLTLPLFALHAAVTLWVTLHHEAWRDEADVWLVMRDGDPGAIFGLTAYRGTPLLWYLVVGPFARAGLPYVAQQLVNLAFAWGAVLLLLRSRAFPWPVKVLFPFSYYAAFEYAVVARNYALLMFLTFLMAEQWRRRRERPLRLAVTIALLANVAVHGLVIAALAGALLLAERIAGHGQGWRGATRQRGAAPEAASNAHRNAAVAVMLAGGLLSVVQLWPRAGGQTIAYVVSADTAAVAIAGAFFPSLRTEAGVLPGVLVLVLVAIAVSRWAVPTVLLLAGSALLLLVLTFVWMGGLRHAGLLLIVAVAALWIADAYGPLRGERPAMAGLAVSLALSVVPAAEAWVAETRHAYSGSLDVATFIRTSGLERTAVVIPEALRHSPFVYLPRTPVWNAAVGRYEVFSRWDRQWQKAQVAPVATAVERAEEQFAGRKWLLLLTHPLPEEVAKRYRLLHVTSVPIWARADETYWLYEPLERP